jgi:hypothetical protein
MGKREGLYLILQIGSLSQRVIYDAEIALKH